MRSVRWLVAGAALLALVVLVAFALQSSGSPERAIAVAATPVPWDVEWDVEAPEQPVAGSIVRVAAEAILTTSFATSPASQPLYRLAVMGDDSALDLRSPADVSPDDVSDGAEWELAALRRGEAAVEVSLTYKQHWCYPCDTHFYTDSTTRMVTVKPLPGDVDCNVAANSIDAALILQLAASMVDELPCQDAADVNQDGSVNAVDATLILQYAAGLLDGLSL